MIAVSAKGMESDMIAEMVSAVNRNSSVCIKAIVGDDDSTTISRLRANIDKNIRKISDANHVKKIFGNNLYSVKKRPQNFNIQSYSVSAALFYPYSCPR